MTKTNENTYKFFAKTFNRLEATRLTNTELAQEGQKAATRDMLESVVTVAHAHKVLTSQEFKKFTESMQCKETRQKVICAAVNKHFPRAEIVLDFNNMDNAINTLKENGITSWKTLQEFGHPPKKFNPEIIKLAKAMLDLKDTKQFSGILVEDITKDQKQKILDGILKAINPFEYTEINPLNSKEKIPPKIAGFNNLPKLPPEQRKENVANVLK